MAAEEGDIALLAPLTMKVVKTVGNEGSLNVTISLDLSTKSVSANKAMTQTLTHKLEFRDKLDPESPNHFSDQKRPTFGALES